MPYVHGPLAPEPKLWLSLLVAGIGIGVIAYQARLVWKARNRDEKQRSTTI